MTTQKDDQAGKARKALGDISSRLAALHGLTVNELRIEFGEVYGFPTHSRNRVYLMKRVAWKIQADAEGGLSQRALDRIEALAPLAPVRWRPGLKDVQIPGEPDARPASSGAKAGHGKSKRDPRLPKAGTLITREYREREYQVLVLEDGFEFGGRPYTTLSKIAREITGTNWNGFLFFKESLQSPRREKA